jgi:hypothetical protein
MGTINELNTTDTLVDEDKLVIWKKQAGATRAITAEDAAAYFSLSGGPYQPLDELLTAIAGQGPNTANGDFIQLTGMDTVRVRKLTVATYAALTIIPDSFRFDDMLVYVASRATDGDGGEGWWRFDAASSATANGATILAPDAGTGRWIRQDNRHLNAGVLGGTNDDLGGKFLLSDGTAAPGPYLGPEVSVGGGILSRLEKSRGYLEAWMFGVRPLGKLTTNATQDQGFSDMGQWLRERGGTLRFGQGEFASNNTIDADCTLAGASDWSDLSQRPGIIGEGSNATRLILLGNSKPLIRFAAPTWGQFSNCVLKGMEISGSTLGASTARSAVGLEIRQMLGLSAEDVNFTEFLDACDIEDLVHAEWSRCRWIFNRRGITGALGPGGSLSGSPVNEVAFNHCHWIANREYCGTFTESANIAFFGGAMEGNGKYMISDGMGGEVERGGPWGADAAPAIRYGFLFDECGLNGGNIVQAYGLHEETNEGLFAFWIKHRQYPGQYLFNGCDFYRNPGTTTTPNIYTHPIAIDYTGDAPGKVIVDCAYPSFNYTPSTSRRVVNVTARPATAADRDQFSIHCGSGNVYQNASERPFNGAGVLDWIYDDRMNGADAWAWLNYDITLADNAAMSVYDSGNVFSIVKLAGGVAQVNLPASIATTFVNIIAFSHPSSPTVLTAQIVARNAGEVRFIVRDSAGTVTSNSDIYIAFGGVRLGN